VDNNKGLIIYGTKGDYHVAVEQLPIYVGVKEFCFMDGGYEAWTGAGNKVDTGKVAPVPATFKANVTNPHFYMSTDEMITVVKDKKPGVSIIDTRSESEFNALENTILRGGRIPGAILIPVDKNLDENGKMLSKDKLAELYGNIPKDNKVILYCHRGCRTAFSYYALENMGYKDIVIYEDSYIVWGSRMDTPVENEHYINLRAYTKRIKALEDEAAK
jgi:thiosulfate/3-mercaptopyruvate sulfurtransferase